MNIDEIAKLAKVSKTTISFYLNNKTDKMSKATYQKIKQIIEKYNYVPEENARKLRMKVSDDIGIIVGNMEQEFSISLFRSLRKNLDVNQNSKFNLFLFESNLLFSQEEKIIKHLLAKKFRYLIIQSSIELEKNIDQIVKQSSESKSEIILVDPQKHYAPYSTFIRQYDNAINQIINKYQSLVKQVIFISEPIEVLATRLVRNDLIAKISRKQKLEFKFWQFDDQKTNLAIKNNLAAMQHKLDKVLLIANNTETMLGILTLIRNLKIDASKLNLVTFNKCNFNTLVASKIDEIVTNTDQVGTKIAKTIQEQKQVHQNIEATLLKSNLK